MSHYASSKKLIYCTLWFANCVFLRDLQVLVRWSLQKGFIPLPKSIKPKRQAENIDVFDFELDQQDMSTLDKLESYYVVAWDPITQDPV